MSTSHYFPSTTPTNSISNFNLSFPDSSSEGSGDEEEGEEQNRRPRLKLDGDEEDDDLTSNTDCNREEEDDVLELGVGGRSTGTSFSSSALSSALRRQRLRHEGRDEDDEDMLSDTIMSVIWNSGKVGAAFYHLDTSELLVLPDTAEAGPDFYVLRSLFRQVVPRCLLINGAQDEDFRKLADELCGDEDQPSPSSSGPGGAEPRAQTQLIHLQSKLFSPEGCKQRLLAIKLPFEPKDNNDQEHNLFITALLPIGNERTIRAAGALLQYLDKRGRELFQIQLAEGHVPVLNISPCTMDDIVMVDDTAWRSLQIFSLDMHPSSIKQGMFSAAKEGLSVFSLLKQGCSTAAGTRALRLMLLRPSRDESILCKRYDIIEYCNHPRNLEFTRAAKDCLKNMKNLPKLLYKLTLLHASVTEWKDLYNTMYHIILLGEICAAQPRSIVAFRELGDCHHLEILRDLTGEMIRVIDFPESVGVDRIVARQGIDPRIDNKKHQFSCLPEIMALVAREEINNLPFYITKCSIVYIPEVGYLLCCVIWRESFTVDDLQIDGFDYSFHTNDSVYYKTPRTMELDVVLGDCQVAILELETGIMICLTERILAHSTTLLRVGRLAAELDCLISMSTLAKSYTYTRPRIVAGDKNLEIIGGRHPLVEEIGECVQNTTKFRDEQRLVVLTGPNASGKSVYLKQIGVITIMALSGSFVPASSAKIPTFNRICTRIHALESISTGFSSFMMDLNQMSFALRCATKESLVIIDEFGKGTAEVDGLSLLVASVDDFLKRKGNCPTAFFSTHFNSMMNYLKPTPVLKLQTMKFLQQNATSLGGITYLYELVDGVSPSSFAHHVARQVGIPEELIARSAEVEKVVRNQVEGSTLHPLPFSAENQNRTRSLFQLAERFLTLGISSPEDSNTSSSTNSPTNTSRNHPFQSTPTNSDNLSQDSDEDGSMYSRYIH